MPEDTKKVNQFQLTAIQHGPGPLLVIAGAGTGKTTVITERVKWLIAQKLASPEEILALTFTEKAAAEMEARIDVALPLGYTQIWASTFHSFCDRILRDDGIHIGLNSNYRLITETDATSLLRRHLFDWELNYFRPLGNPNKFIAGILQHFSRLQDEDTSPSDYLAWAEKQPDLASPDPAAKVEAEKFLELAHIFQLYSELKISSGVMDFSDLICSALKLLRTRPNILKNYQTKFKYILVDEFQDTNFAQNQLVLLLGGPINPNLTVVADDDQSIYRWRGAAISNVIQFHTTFPDAKLVVLTQNYRSTQEILDRSYDLIQFNNPDRLETVANIDKKLIAGRKIKGAPIEFFHFDRVENEADAVAKKIQELIDKSEGKLTYKSFAVLVRANAHSDPFVRSFSRYSIPFQFLGPAQLFHQPEVKDLVAYLQLLNNLDEDASCFRVLSMDFFHLHPRDLAALGSFAKRLNLHLFEACEFACGFPVTRSFPAGTLPPVISQETGDQLKKLITIIHRHLGLLSKESAGQILFYFLQDSGLLSAVLNYQLPLDEKKADNIMKLFNKLKSFEVNHTDASVPAIVDWLELSAEIGESPQAADVDWSENDSVNILTLHSAKGLEFPVVFLVNLVSQRFPSMERKEPIPIPEALVKEILPKGDDFHLQEERRLFYVGMTRACDRLFFTAADFYGEAKRAKKLSPFITESLSEKNLTLSRSPALQLSILDWQKPSTSPAPAFISSPLPVTYLSYSQIQTFIDCPLHYKAKYILKIPSAPAAAGSFGNTIHLTMKDFYDAIKRGDQPDILQIYAKNWLPEGFIDRRQEQLYFARGQEFLKKYLATEFDPAHLPKCLEQPFTVPLDGLKIGGKIDRVDVSPDGSIEIIDYKTSTKSLTDKEAAANLQLSFYALAATTIPDPPFHKRPDQVRLTLYYFDEGKKVTTTRTSQQLEAAKQEIYAYAKAISASDFACSGSIICRQCDYKMLCDIRGGIS